MSVKKIARKSGRAQVDQSDIKFVFSMRNWIWWFIKAHRQISKKWCFERYCSCDQACQFSAI